MPVYEPNCIPMRLYTHFWHGLTWFDMKLLRLKTINLVYNVQAAIFILPRVAVILIVYSSYLLAIHLMHVA
jgi:hypothetical protein